MIKCNILKQIKSINNYICNYLKNIDKKIMLIIKSGINVSFILSILAMFVLISYEITSNPSTFYIGISLFKSSLFFIISFIIGGVAFSKIVSDCK